ncbi:hypothetical protein [Methylomonas koyamae]|uniref:hypothetical protein n=1 Tax=Methylomonas koyamae TaxID=702114 RepID=UPI0006D06C17|nr:hypothetical protein [Methylomonas koyamae]
MIEINPQDVEKNSVQPVQQPEVVRSQLTPDAPSPANPYFDELNQQQPERSLLHDELVINNAAGSILNATKKEYNIDYPAQAGYEPYRDDRTLFNQIKLDDYPSLMDSRSPQELRMKLRKLHDEDAARENISRNGALGVLGAVVTGVADPINLVPMVGQSTKARMAWAAATTAVDEAALQASQEHRTAQETALNIGTATAFTGVLSALANRYGAKAPILPDGVPDPHAQPDYVPIQSADSVGAAATPDALIDTFTADDTKLVGGWLTKLATKGPMGGVGAKLMQSPNPEIRSLANEVFDHGFVTVGNTKGKAINSVEALIEDTKNSWVSKIEADRQAGFAEYVKNAEQAVQQFSKKEFNELVQRQLRYGDVVDSGIVKAAENIRKMIDDFGKVLYEHDKISNPDNVYGAVHMFPRDYQKSFARLNANEVITKLADRIEAKWKADPKELQRAMDTTDGSFHDVRAEALDVAKSVYNHIIGGKSEFPATTGRRKLRLEDKDLMFLINEDPYEIAYKYLARTAPKIELLNRFGSYNADQLLKDALAKNTDLKLNAKPSEQKALEAARVSDEENFKVAFNRLLGNPNDTGATNAYKDGLNFLNNFLVSTKMGKALIASLNDVGASVMINGPIKSMEHYGKALLDFSDLGKLQKAQATRMATAWDRVASDRAKDLEEIMSSSNPNNFINDFMAKTSATLMKASGLPKWTTFGQGVNGTIASIKSWRLVKG